MSKFTARDQKLDGQLQSSLRAEPAASRSTGELSLLVPCQPTPGLQFSCTCTTTINFLSRHAVTHRLPRAADCSLTHATLSESCNTALARHAARHKIPLSCSTSAPAADRSNLAPATSVCPAEGSMSSPGSALSLLTPIGKLFSASCSRSRLGYVSLRNATSQSSPSELQFYHCAAHDQHWPRHSHVPQYRG